MKRFPIVALGVLILAAAGVAEACKCAAPPPPKDALAGADAVFTAKCIAVSVKDGKKTCTFEVDRVWKGEVGPKVVITTAEHSATCGYGFSTEGDATYFIYAYGKKGALSTHTCSRTRALASAKDDLKDLGDGAKPKEEKKAE
jgi:hypothetical protein